MQTIDNAVHDHIGPSVHLGRTLLSSDLLVEGGFFLSQCGSYCCCTLLSGFTGSLFSGQLDVELFLSLLGNAKGVFILRELIQLVERLSAGFLSLLLIGVDGVEFVEQRRPLLL